MVSMVIPTLATENQASPFLNNTNTIQNAFVIDENGLAIVSFTCRGYRGITTSIVVDTKIEKQSGSSWVQVGGASWTDNSSLYYCVKEHSIQLESTGTYKATFTFTVSGSGGATDVITREIEKTY